MKLQLNELMVGDWVHPMGHPDIKVQVRPEDYINLVEYEPIIITPEILEKIGFASVRNVGYIIDDYNGTQVIYDRFDSNLRIIKDYKVRLDIDFFGDMSVHELQHALRLLEIEKEIMNSYGKIYRSI